MDDRDSTESGAKRLMLLENGGDGNLDKGIANRAHYLCTLRPVKLGPGIVIVEIRVYIV
jgi:hypothetical protein